MCGSLLTLAGCSSDTDNSPVVAPTDKQPIELCVGVDNAMTRAVVTNTPGSAFAEETGLWMIMKSEYVSLGGGNTDLDFKGDDAAKGTKYTVTYAVTGAKAKDKDNHELNESTVNFGKNTRYWDDAHARSSKLSVWAIAVPGKTGALKANPEYPAVKSWTTAEESTSVSWAVSAAQTAQTVTAEDLCFSNNIANDARMKFKIDPRGFEKGKLNFYHALTKITVKLVEGEGFDHTSADDFNFDGGNVTLKGFNVDGTFDVAEGEFTGSFTSGNITSMACGDKTTEGYTLEALVMPGTNLNELDLTDAISFSIDKNAFKVSSATLLAKLKEKGAVANDWTTMEAGKNYVFTFFINKTGIKVTATIAPWVNVEAETEYPKINISQVYGHLDTEDGCDKLQEGFSFYRSTTVASGYDPLTSSTVSYSNGAYSMSPQLYWPNHQTHYFFRGIYPVVGSENGQTPTAKVTTSAITVTNSGYTANTFPSDLMLGYPRNTDGTPDETCKVHSETQGICATEGDIRMNFQYVMSQVEVQLTTSTGNDKVVLDENTTIEIIGGYKSGSITLENGTATYTDSDKGTYTMSGTNTKNSNAYDRRDAIIPQSLTNLKFKITVKNADNTYDSYDATIADIKVDGNTIGAWAPGKMYIYHLYVTKTAMKLTATLKNWETVESGNNHIWM